MSHKDSFTAAEGDAIAVALVDLFQQVDPDDLDDLGRKRFDALDLPWRSCHRARTPESLARAVAREAKRRVIHQAYSW